MGSEANKSERLLQLTSALLYSKRGLTRKELFFAIDGYHSDVADEASVQRKFERDKADLRNLGIQIKTIDATDEGEDQRYLIAADTFSWPKGVELTPHQLQLLELAAAAWSKASISTEVNQGLVKIKSLGVVPAENNLIGVLPSIRTPEPAFAPLMKAIEYSVEVSFRYRRADGEIKLRRVQPWRLHNIDGQWMLVSFDLEEGQVRNFLLKRIVSRISLPPANQEAQFRFEAPDEKSVTAAINDLAEFASKNLATLRIRRDTAAWLHFGIESPNDQEEISVNYLDLALLAEQLSDFIFDLEVLAPEELRKTLREGFERLAVEHG